jgi:uncharacterized protein
MDEGLYNKAIKCPVCEEGFEVTKVKMKACKVLSRDSDFCVFYEGINPLYYDVWVCENCGYSAQSDKFEEISDREASIIQAQISKLWKKRSFVGNRNIDTAIETFKLALFNQKVRKAKSSEIAKVCLRIAWLYRMKKDEKEKEFLQYALNCYNEAYEKEKFPIDKLDEFTCMYIIAELHRRVGNLEEAVKWFSRLVGNSEARKNPTLIESAREQFQLAKEQMGK